LVFVKVFCTPDIGFIIYTDTWKKDVKPRDIEDAINQAALGKLRVISVSEVISFSGNLQWELIFDINCL